MIATLFFYVNLGPENDFTPEFFLEDAPSNSLQYLYQDILSTSCDVVLDD